MTKTNRIHVVAYTALGLVLLFLAIMWARTATAKNHLITEVNNNYDRAFFELTDYVGDIDVLLTKAQLAGTPAQMASIAGEIFKESAEAKSCFGQLPQGNFSLDNTARFLSQVGDYTYVLSQNMINGEEITQEQYTTLSELNDFASALTKSLEGIQAKIYNGEISFNVAEGESLVLTALAEDDIFADLENVEKSFEGYPSLIYDGPFSEHIENAESPMISTAEAVSQDKALKLAEEFTGYSGLTYQGDMTNTAIECYLFGKSDDNGEISVAVTKKGGFIMYFINSRSVANHKLGIEEAYMVARDYLRGHGFTDMVESYFEITNNVATVNFAYSQNGVKMYSDLIKLRIALDDGEVIGIETKGYLMNHREREVPLVTLSETEAEACVSTNLDVTATDLCIIPKDSLREVLCYEFHGTYKDKNFIIYVNAENGREEEILLLIESETGILTV